MSDASMKTQVDELGNGFLRLPPQDLEAEKSLLASVLKSEGRDFAALKRIVPLGAFYKEAHNQIYNAMDRLFGIGERIDVLTLIAALENRAWLKDAGGAYYITGLGDEAFVEGVDFIKSAFSVRDCWFRRESIRECYETIETLYNSKEAEK